MQVSPAKLCPRPCWKLECFHGKHPEAMVQNQNWFHLACWGEWTSRLWWFLTVVGGGFSLISNIYHHHFCAFGNWNLLWINTYEKYAIVQHLRVEMSSPLTSCKIKLKATLFQFPSRCHTNRPSQVIVRLSRSCRSQRCHRRDFGGLLDFSLCRLGFVWLLEPSKLIFRALFKDWYQQDDF